jgi:hypothetical protein
MFRRILVHPLSALAFTAVLAGCDTAVGPRSESTILLSSGSGSSASFSMAAAGALVGGEEKVSSASVASVGSIVVKITAVQALPAHRDENDSGGWISLPVHAGGEFDLMKLSETGVELAKGELAAGTYSNVRLMVEDGAITFKAPVTIGSGASAKTYEADKAYPLIIPSGPQTGIKVPTAGFVVTESTGDVVTIVFSADASVQAVQALPTGVQMSPVLTARGK